MKEKLSAAAGPPARPLPQALGVWRRWAAPEAGSAAVGALGIVAAVDTLLGLEGAVPSIIRLVGWLVVPGWAVVRHLRLSSSAARAVAILSVAFVLDAVLGVGMVWTGWWVPIGAGVVLLLAASLSMLIPVAGRRTVLPAVRWRGSADAAFLAIVVAVLVAWSTGLTDTDTSHLGDWGLLPAFPPAWWVALAASLVLFGAQLWAVEIRPLRAAIAAGLLTVIIYGSADLVEAVPRLPWAYKHIGVTSYIAAHGTIDLGADIYNRWPGFFAASAVTQIMAGLDSPVDYIRYAGLLFALLNAVLVFVLGRSLSPNVRVAWIAVGVFTLSNWIGQNYYSPQAFAFTLHLAMCALALRYLRGRPASGLDRLEQAVGRRVRGGDAGRRDVATRMPVVSRRTAVLLVLVLLIAQAVISASHQLTPYLTALALVPLFAAGYFRPRWAALPLALIPLAYLLPNLPFLQSKYGLFTSFDLFANATYTPSAAVKTYDAQLVQGYGADAIVLIVAAMAVVGTIRFARSRSVRTGIMVAWLGLSPAIILVAQSYGGEGRLRAYLFALPWLSIAAAWAFVGREPARVRPNPVPLFGIGTLLAVLITFVYFQPEGDVRVAPADFAAGQWLDTQLRPGDLAIGELYTLPVLFGPDYADLLPESWPSTVLESAVQRAPGTTTPAQLDRIITNAHTGRRVYLVLSAVQERYAARHLSAAIHPLTTLSREAGGAYPMVYDRDGTRIFLVRG